MEPSPRVAVVAGGTEGDVPEPALVDLLGGPLGIGAVVPLLFDVHGRVVEAGTFVSPSGAVTAFNPGAALPASGAFVPPGRGRQRLTRRSRFG